MISRQEQGLQATASDNSTTVVDTTSNTQSDPNVIPPTESMADQFSRQMLWQAIISGDVDNVAECVTPQNIETKDARNRTPLCYAASHKMNDVVELLLSRNANIHAQDTKGTALHVAAFSGDVETVRILLANNARVNDRCSDGFTPLHFLCSRKTENIEICNLLVDAGAEVNVESIQSKTTSLHFAAQMGALDVIKRLLLANANVNALDAHRIMPLSRAINSHNLDLNNERFKEAIKVLINGGASLSNAESTVSVPRWVRDYFVLRSKDLQIAQLQQQISMLRESIPQRTSVQNSFSEDRWPALEEDKNRKEARAAELERRLRETEGRMQALENGTAKVRQDLAKGETEKNEHKARIETLQRTLDQSRQETQTAQNSVEEMNEHNELLKEQLRKQYDDDIQRQEKDTKFPWDTTEKESTSALADEFESMKMVWFERLDQLRVIDRTLQSEDNNDLRKLPDQVKQRNEIRTEFVALSQKLVLASEEVSKTTDQLLKFVTPHACESLENAEATFQQRRDKRIACLRNEREALTSLEAAKKATELKEQMIEAQEWVEQVKNQLEVLKEPSVLSDSEDELLLLLDEIKDKADRFRTTRSALIAAQAMESPDLDALDRCKSDFSDARHALIAVIPKSRIGTFRGVTQLQNILIDETFYSTLFITDFDVHSLTQFMSYKSAFKASRMGADFVLKRIENRERAELEFHTLTRLKHPYVLHAASMLLFSYTKAFLVYPWINGKTLNDWLISEEKPGQADIRRMFYYVLQGVDYIHEQGVVHGDISLTNIMMKQDDQGLSPIIGGFDYCVDPTFVSADQKSSIENSSRQVGVTREPVSKASDIFAVGLCLWEASFPKQACDMQDPQPQIPDTDVPGLGETLSCMLQLDPAKRLPARKLLSLSFFAPTPASTEQQPQAAQARFDSCRK